MFPLLQEDAFIYNVERLSVEELAKYNTLSNTAVTITRGGREVAALLSKEVPLPASDLVK